MGHFLSLFFAFLQSFFLVNGNNDKLTHPPLVPINRDLYHSSLSFWNIANPTNSLPGCAIFIVFLACFHLNLSNFLTSKKWDLKKIRKPKPWKRTEPITRTQLMQMRDEFWDTAPHYGGQKEIWDAL